MKNMKIFKRIITLCLLVVVAVMFIPGVLAEFSTDNNTLTVSGLETGTDKNVSVSLYKIMNVNTQNGQLKDPVYIWDSNVAAWLTRDEASALYKSFVGTNNAVTDEFNKDLSDTVVAQFYDDLADAIRSGSLSVSPVDTKNAGGAASVEFKPLELGVYFVLANKGKRVYKPTSVNIVPEKDETSGDWEVKNTSVTLKSSGPGIEKEVEDADLAKSYIGKPIKYTLKLTVPSYPENTTNKTLYLGDVLSAGLDYVKDETGTYATVVTADGDTLTKGTHYSLSFDDASRTLEIHFDGDGTEAGKHKYYDEIKDYNVITVTYYARLNENAIVRDGTAETDAGNINTVTLHYNNDPYGFEDPMPEDEVTVYTYGLDLLKVDKKDNSKVLKGAEFEVSKNSDGSSPMSFVKIADGEYRLVKEGETGTTNLVAPNGTLKVYGLGEGNYYVTETKAPTGYIVDPTHHPVEIADSDNDGKVDEDGLVTFKFENTDSVVKLPVTGGIGTLIFSIVGILFMGTSIVLVRNILKKKEVQL